jgi:hypothetical protein
VRDREKTARRIVHNYLVEVRVDHRFNSAEERLTRRIAGALARAVRRGRDAARMGKARS